MPRYSAHYKNPLTGRIIVETRPARDYQAARYELPRWIYPNGTPMRRVGSVKIEKANT